MDRDVQYGSTNVVPVKHADDILFVCLSVCLSKLLWVYYECIKLFLNIKNKLDEFHVHARSIKTKLESRKSSVINKSIKKYYMILSKQLLNIINIP
jgi:hypothetical protein